MDFLFQMIAAVTAKLLSPLSVAVFAVAAPFGFALAALPGISPITALAVMLPVAFVLPWPTGTICLVGVVVAMQYGRAAVAGASCAGDPAADPSAIRLLPIATAALIGGTVVAVAALVLAPPLASVASHALLLFGPAEYAALIILLLISAIGLGSRSMVRGTAVVLIGLLLGVVGTDVETGVARFTFGLEELQDGIGLIPLAIGIFVIADIIRRLEPKRIPGARGGDAVAPPPIPAAILLGALAGILPASDRALTTAADDDRGEPPGPLEPAGQPSADLVARAAAAANARLSACFVPLLAAGLAVNAVAVAIKGAIAFEGVLSGATTAGQQAVYYIIFGAIIVANIMGFLAVLTVGRFVRVLGRLDVRIVAAVLLMLSCYSVYIINDSAFDVGLMTVFGVLGYLLLKLDCERSLLLIAFVLGYFLEEQIRRALLITRGSVVMIAQRPIVAMLIILAAVILVAGRILQKKRMLR